jgi:hypothetical protein
MSMKRESATVVFRPAGHWKNEEAPLHRASVFSGASPGPAIEPTPLRRGRGPQRPQAASIPIKRDEPIPTPVRKGGRPSVYADTLRAMRLDVDMAEVDTEMEAKAMQSTAYGLKMRPVVRKLPNGKFGVWRTK